jgi:hypothetical protein
MVTTLLMGLWFRNSLERKGYSLHSFVTVGVVFVSGEMPATLVVARSPMGGLLERTTICVLFQWMLVIALATWRDRFEARR